MELPRTSLHHLLRDDSSDRRVNRVQLPETSLRKSLQQLDVHFRIAPVSALSIESLGQSDELGSVGFVPRFGRAAMFLNVLVEGCERQMELLRVVEFAPIGD